MTSLRPLLLAVLLGVTAGCTTEYAYRPVSADAVVAGYPASHYAIPAADPEGDVAVASFGISDASPDGGSEATTMHVRFYVSNERGAGPWSLDTREIEMDLPGEGKSRAAMVNASVPGLPVLSIAPGQQVAVDAFFPLPDTMSSEEDLPAFDIRWTVHTAGAPVSQRTSFGREDASEPPPRTTYVYGPSLAWGAYWYWDPLWPSYRFVHVQRAFFYPGARVVVVSRGGVRGRGRGHIPAHGHRR